VDGGAIFVGLGRSALIEWCSFIDNSAPMLGGAIACNDGGPTTEIVDCRFTGNTASGGGAVRCGGGSGFTASIRNCLFWDNTATYDNPDRREGGGAIECGSDAEVIGCTIYACTATYGGGIYNVGLESLTINRTIIAGCQGGDVQCYTDRPLESVECSDFYGNDYDWDGCADEFLLPAERHNLWEDVRFCDPGDPANWDFQLSASSPCSRWASPCGEQIGAVGVSFECDASMLGQISAAVDRSLLTVASLGRVGLGTQIDYVVPEDGMNQRVHVTIQDPTGRMVRRLVDAAQPAGSYSVTWDGQDEAGQMVPGGIYFCRLGAAGHSAVKRVLLLR
jgi:predicted outer membrane repeat protein